MRSWRGNCMQNLSFIMLTLLRIQLNSQTHQNYKNKIILKQKQVHKKVSVCSTISICGKINWKIFLRIFISISFSIFVKQNEFHFFFFHLDVAFVCIISLDMWRRISKHRNNGETCCCFMCSLFPLFDNPAKKRN